MIKELIMGWYTPIVVTKIESVTDRCIKELDQMMVKHYAKTDDIAYVAEYSEMIVRAHERFLDNLADAMASEGTPSQKAPKTTPHAKGKSSVPYRVVSRKPCLDTYNHHYDRFTVHPFIIEFRLHTDNTRSIFVEKCKLSKTAKRYIQPVVEAYPEYQRAMKWVNEGL